jgi:hypothetical protein
LKLIIIIPSNSNLSGRFYVAAAFSKKDSSRIISGWKIWRDSEGTPLSFSTVQEGFSEPIHAQVRRINPLDPREAVMSQLYKKFQKQPITLRHADCSG